MKKGIRIGVSNILIHEGNVISGGLRVIIGRKVINLTWDQAEFLAASLNWKLKPSETGTPNIWPVEV